SDARGTGAHPRAAHRGAREPRRRGRGPRLRPRRGPERGTGRAAVLALLHHQERWPGHRPGDLPLDHRIPRGAAVLRAARGRWQRVRLHPAARRRKGASMTVTRVYLVDDNDGFRDSTAWLLETAGYEVEAFASGAAFLEAYAGNRHGEASECLVSDIRMPQMSGLQLQDELTRRGIQLPVVFVTAHGDVPLAVEAMRKGASNFLEKPFSEDALIDALRTALANARNRGNGGGMANELLGKLSPRERQVLDLVVASKPNKIIADILGISIKTVELHRANMMSKLGVRSLPELMKVALGHG